VTVAGRDPATPPNRKPAKSCQQGQPIPRCPPPLAHAEVDARGHPTPGGRRRFLPLLEVCVDRAIRLAVAAASAAVVFLGMWMVLELMQLDRDRAQLVGLVAAV